MTIKLNKWIDKFSEIKPHLDDLLDRTIERDGWLVENDGCDNKVVNQVVRYLTQHDCQVTVESRGTSALSRLYG